MKFALISHVLPPSPSGQSVTLSRLLERTNPDDYCLISKQVETVDEAKDEGTSRLPGKRYSLPQEFALERGYKLGLKYLRESFNLFFGILMRSRRITSIIRRENCQAVVACTGDLMDMPAAYLAARRNRLPFYAYIFDHYSYREWIDPLAAFWARRFEPFLLRRAAGVVAVNETLRDDLRKRYGVESALIHNSVELSELEDNLNARTIEPEDEIRIVYTGEIYEAHYDACENLLKAIDMTGRRNLRMHIYTGQSPSLLAEKGIAGPVVFHPHVARSAVPQLLNQADILFLPLAFNSPYPDLVRTSATTKLGDYLAARRPILAHAPRDSFVAWYFHKYQCGLIVDESDPARLAQAIEELLNDKRQGETMAARAWDRVQADFNLSKAQAQFAAMLNLNNSRSLSKTISQTAGTVKQ